MRMKKMRVWVLAARQFLTELSDVFYDVRSNYQRQIEELLAKKKQQQLIPKQQSKELSVFVSANSKLYGDIIDRVFEKFAASIKEKPTDVMIIGKLGKSLYEQAGLSHQYLYFEVPDSEVKVEDLKPIIFNLLKYNKINVYYGEFENVITQNPTVANITGDDPFKLVGGKQRDKKETNIKYLFEPSLEKILDFFQTQVFSSLFKQTMHEAHLAHFASRIRAMEEAINNIDGARVKLNSERKRLQRTIENRKVLERIAGLSLWS